MRFLQHLAQCYYYDDFQVSLVVGMTCCKRGVGVLDLSPSLTAPLLD